jgi:hypothetical protein
MLLRGHLQLAFTFCGSKPSQRLVKQRTLPFDYSLPWRRLMEQGARWGHRRLQAHGDLRPGLPSIAVAYVRWLKGDLDGAIEVARLAAQAATHTIGLLHMGVDAPRAYYLQLAFSTCQGGLRRGSMFSPNILRPYCCRADFSYANRSAEAVSAAACGEDQPAAEFQWALADTLRPGSRRRNREGRRT